jgi:hypothetical protein
MEVAAVAGGLVVNAGCCFRPDFSFAPHLGIA